MDQQRIFRVFGAILDLENQPPADVEERYFEELDRINFDLKWQAVAIWNRHMNSTNDVLNDFENHVMAEATKAIVRHHMGEAWAREYMVDETEIIH